jgi:hypothetical protein
LRDGSVITHLNPIIKDIIATIENPKKYKKDNAQKIKRQPVNSLLNPSIFLPQKSQDARK